MSLESRVSKAIRSIPDFPKQGIVFKDISPILTDVQLFSDVVDAFVQAGREMNVNAIAGIESRGFYLGPIIAHKLGIPFIPIRKRGRFPNNHIEHYAYDLEFGSSVMEMNPSDLPTGAKVMLHDDLLATGSTAAAAARLIKNAGGQVAMFAFIGHLNYLKGDEQLNNYSLNIFTLAEF